MSRLARLYYPETPHLLQVQVLPHAQGDSVPILDAWAQWLEAETQLARVVTHGWALTPSEILLLATPHSAASLRVLIQALGRHITRQRGGGKVFAGRYRSAVVEPGSWVLPALIWLENLPVRQKLATEAEYWRWSSARAHTGFTMPTSLFMHPDYWRCGNTPFDRQANYRRLLHHGSDGNVHRTLEAALRGQWALGSPEFVERVEHYAGRPAAPRPRGRPRKSTAQSRG